MTPGEQASVAFLSQSAIWMQHISNTNSEIAKLKTAVERLTVAVKQPMEEVDTVMGEFKGLVRAIREMMAKGRRGDDDSEPWRESLEE